MLWALPWMKTSDRLPVLALVVGECYLVLGGSPVAFELVCRS